MTSAKELLAYAPKPGTLLCAIDDIENPGARGFVFGTDKKRFDMFVVRREKEIFAYVNSCPHLRTPLEFLNDKFLNAKKTAIVCSTHGARFRIADGYCFAGPCRRESLTAIPLDIHNGQIRLGKR